MPAPQLTVMPPRICLPPFASRSFSFKPPFLTPRFPALTPLAALALPLLSVFPLLAPFRLQTLKLQALLLDSALPCLDSRVRPGSSLALTGFFTCATRNAPFPVIGIRVIRPRRDADTDTQLCQQPTRVLIPPQRLVTQSSSVAGRAPPRIFGLSFAVRSFRVSFLTLSFPLLTPEPALTLLPLLLLVISFVPFLSVTHGDRKS